MDEDFQLIDGGANGKKGRVPDEQVFNYITQEGKKLIEKERRAWGNQVRTH